MRVKGIIWVGTATDDLMATKSFFADVLGMSLVTDVSGFARLAAANGDRVEIFGPSAVEHDQLDTGPVAGFWVEDAAEARDEMLDAAVDGVTKLERGADGHGWFYFKAPDGNNYEVCEHPAPRPARKA